MKRYASRLITMLIALAMVFSLVSAQALADGEDLTPGGGDDLTPVGDGEDSAPGGDEGKSIGLTISVTLPDKSKKDIERSYDLTAGQTEVDVDIISELNAEGIYMQAGWRIYSVGIASGDSYIYSGTPKLRELLTGVKLSASEESHTVYMTIVDGGRLDYYLIHARENVDGTFDYTMTDRYTAVEIDGSTGMGPLFGTTLTIAPKALEGFRYGSYSPVFMLYWDGYLNSKNYGDGYTEGASGFLTAQLGDLGLTYDENTGVISGTAVQTESNFTKYFYYYYSLVRPVIYDANSTDATGTMANGEYINNETVTVAANGYTRSGYDFTGWNTAPDGTGTAYTAGQTFTMGTVENVTLYAQWIPVNTTNPTPPSSEPSDDPNPVPIIPDINIPEDVELPETDIEDEEIPATTPVEPVEDTETEFPDEEIPTTIPVTGESDNTALAAILLCAALVVALIIKKSIKA